MTAAADLTCRAGNVNAPREKSRERFAGTKKASPVRRQPKGAQKSRERDSSLRERSLFLLGGPQLGLERVEIEVELLRAGALDFVGRGPPDAHVGAQGVALEVCESGVILGRSHGRRSLLVGAR